MVYDVESLPEVLRSFVSVRKKRVRRRRERTLTDSRSSEGVSKRGSWLNPVREGDPHDQDVSSEGNRPLSPSYPNKCKNWIDVLL